jgi:hypothetical protein
MMRIGVLIAALLFAAGCSEPATKVHGKTAGHWRVAAMMEESADARTRAVVALLHFDTPAIPSAAVEELRSLLKMKPDDSSVDAIERTKWARASDEFKRLCPGEPLPGTAHFQAAGPYLEVAATEIELRYPGKAPPRVHGQRILAQSKIKDDFATPLLYSQVDETTIEIRGAGKDRSYNTEDDVVLTRVVGRVDQSRTLQR